MFREERKYWSWYAAVPKKGPRLWLQWIVLVAHEGEKAACYSLVYDEVEGCAEGYHTAPGETADKVPLMDGCSLEIIVCGFHEYRQYQQYSNGAGESRKAAEKAAEQVFLFSAHVHAQEACQQEKALGHGGKQEYAAGEQAKQGGREKGGPPVRIQARKAHRPQWRSL